MTRARRDSHPRTQATQLPRPSGAAARPECRREVVTRSPCGSIAPARPLGILDEHVACPLVAVLLQALRLALVGASIRVARLALVHGGRLRALIAESKDVVAVRVVHGRLQPTAG